MSFLDNILKNFQNCNFVGGYRATILGDSGVYVEGVVKIVDVKENEIILSIKNGTLLLKGKNLKVRSFYGGDICILGEITAYEKK